MRCSTTWRVQYGALVLFTSRASRCAAPSTHWPRSCAAWCWCKPAARTLLARHRERVAAGEPVHHLRHAVVRRGAGSARRLCESAFITKLPFCPADDPVGEARAPNG